MKKLALVVLLVAPLCMTGCGWLFGYEEKHVTTSTVEPDGTLKVETHVELIKTRGALEVLGGLASAAGIPWASAVTGAIGAVAFALKNKNKAAALDAAVSGVHAIKDQLTPAQIEKMAQAQGRIGTGARELIRKVANKIEGKS